ncbi:MAG: hypothetical protein M1434_01360 [Chloroflexi bacterium]|nr:hypothetical protein [Chloroflexota bacterium]MCL5273379.1 hypothetical protein [Chloroflexota bacterium]
MKQRKKEIRFVICIQNEGCEDLELGKIYQVLPDESAANEDYLRVIDESGEDYLYPGNYFIPIALPQAAERAVLALSKSKAPA